MAMSETGYTFASCFAFAVDAICGVLCREGFRRGPQELVGQTMNRIHRLHARFNALVARWRAGRLVAEEGTPHPGPLPQGEREKHSPLPLWERVG